MASNKIETVGLDTGTGGFVGPDGNVYYYDPLLDGAPTPSGKDRPIQRVNVNVDPVPGNDLSTKTKKTLKDYIVGVSRDSSSHYKVPSQGVESGEPQIDIDLGYVSPYPEGSFQGNNVPGPLESLSSRSGVVDADGLRGKFLRGGDSDVSQGKLNGNDLLTTGIENNNDSPAVLKSPLKEYSNAVLSNNRFTSNAYKDFLSNRVVSSADTAGVFIPTEDNSWLGKNGMKSEKSTTFERLKAVGPVLSINASGEYFGESDPGSLGAVAGALLPGLQQLVLPTKGDSDEFDVLKIEKGLGDPTITEIDIQRTWGAMNNVNDHFESLGTPITSLVLLAVVTTVVKVVALGLSLIIPTPSATRQLVPGKYSSKVYADNGWQKFFRFLFPVSNPHSDKGFMHRFDAGVKAFFRIELLDAFGLGINFPNPIKTGVESESGFPALVEFSRNSGFTLVSCREIIRSITTIVPSQWLGGGASAQGKVFESVGGIMSLIDTLSRSKLIKMINHFVTLGDRVLSGENDDLNLPYDDEEKTKSISLIDAASYYEGKYKADFKDRLLNNLERFDDLNVDLSNLINSHVGSDGKRYYVQANRKFVNDTDGSVARNMKMAWSADSSFTNIMGLFESGFSTKISSEQYFSLEQNEMKGQTQTVNVKLTDEQVVLVEKYLNSEYMPFYFRDMRTNEIVSFHAFLDSLTDGYSASYDTHEGIGRVEPIKIYKSTQRKFGFSFYVVSTGPKDIHDMYEKINKLTTLVYPQYTRGKKIITTDGYTYRQPFSQLAGASPMIRVKIGDIARSNYSRFDLARLFGFGNVGEAELPSETKTKKVTTTETLSFDAALEKHKSDLEFTAISHTVIKPVGNSIGSIELNTKSAKAVSTGVTYSVNDPAAPYKKGGKHPFDIDYRDYSKIMKFKWDDNSRAFLNTETTIQLTGTKTKTPVIYKIPFGTYKVAKDSVKEPKGDLIRKMVGLSYVYDGNSFKKFQTSEETTLTSFVDMFTPENNSIVRTFENNSGSGLAGFIESLDFDWDVKMPWEVDELKAPKMCKVTVSFSPIHDITPGMDHRGYNRAKIY